MTPQSTFLIVAPITPAREAELRGLLESMHDATGRLNTHNALVPFGRFDALHVARFLVVEDLTLNDIQVYGLPAPRYPHYLAFAGDLDGDRDACLDQLAADARTGLETLFSCCDGFAGGASLAAWMKSRNVAASATYVNWRGRTVRQVREEAALHDTLEQHVDRQSSALKGLPPTEIHRRLRALVDADLETGRLTLSAERSTPLGWRIRNLVHLVGVPLAFLLLSPLLLVIAIVALVRLRSLEKTDRELCWRDADDHAAELARIEDLDVSNQFSAMGTLKPGIVRLGTTVLVLLAIDYAARHLYTRGRLARVRTIHFARWVFLDRRQRIIFLSNYDGSLEAYMDDFINKVGFGLNVVFSNGIGYPRTDWLIRGGCKDERKFKEYLRRHQMPTQVWYKAYPGLTAVDLERNARIREGLEMQSPSDEQARDWVALL